MKHIIYKREKEGEERDKEVERESEYVRGVYELPRNRERKN